MNKSELAKRMAMPVPPSTRLSGVNATQASTGRSSISPSNTAGSLACSLRTAGEHRSHAGCYGAAISMQATISAADGTRQSGPRSPL